MPRGLFMAGCLALIGSGLLLWAFRTGAGEARPADIDPAAKTLLDEVAKTYKGLNAYADHGALAFSIKVNDQAQERKGNLTLAFERPNKLALEADGVKLASDGTTLVTSRAAVQKYMKQEAPKAITLGGILTGPLGAMLVGGPSQVPVMVVLGLLVDDHASQTLIEGAQAVKLGDDRQVDGKAIKAIKI